MSDEVDELFDPSPVTYDAREDVTSLERRFGLFEAQITDMLRAIVVKLDRMMRSDDEIRDELIEMNKRLDRALDGVDGLDVRNRLAAVEDALLPRPKVRPRARK